MGKTLLLPGHMDWMFENGENLEMQGIDRRGRDRVGDLTGLLHTGQEKQTMLLELNHPSLDTMA